MAKDEVGIIFLHVWVKRVCVQAVKSDRLVNCQWRF
ncbi:hypothetical protein CGSHi22121_09495 [Haemophilus influenzae 22.1-21]|nr:hypothetical protein CGSHi22121_09495 [Haemophilus influenzae 22.1-21]